MIEVPIESLTLQNIYDNEKKFEFQFDYKKKRVTLKKRQPNQASLKM